MSNILDVAKLAHVAPATVSRLLNSSGYVSQDAKERIEKAIAELHYVPNSLARSLHFKATHTFGLLLPDILNPVWTNLARGAEDAARESNYIVFLCNTDSDASRQEEYVNVLLQKRVDGMVYVPIGPQVDLRPVNAIRRQQVPFVILDAPIPDSQADTIVVENEQGAYELTRIVIGMGHRRIVMLSGPLGHYTADQRVHGFKRAMQETGMRAEECLVFEGTYDDQGGFAMANQVLELNPQPTALFAGNNVIAVGAIRALRAAGLRVPEDIGIVCFDDVPLASEIDPFLTVALQPSYEIGKKAVEMLLARIFGKEKEEPQMISMPVEIIVRRSCLEYRPEFCIPFSK